MDVQESSLQCTICNIDFSSGIHFNTHVRNHAKVNRKCHRCHRMLFTARQARLHRRLGLCPRAGGEPRKRVSKVEPRRIRFRNITLFECPVCEKVAHSIVPARSHLASHDTALKRANRKGLYTCDDCTHQTPTLSSFRFHVSSQRGCALFVQKLHCRELGISKRCSRCDQTKYTFGDALQHFYARCDGNAAMGQCPECGLEAATETLERHRESRLGCRLLALPGNRLALAPRKATKRSYIKKQPKLEPDASEPQDASCLSCSECGFQSLFPDAMGLHRSSLKACRLFLTRSHAAELFRGDLACAACSVVWKRSSARLDHFYRPTDCAITQAVTKLKAGGDLNCPCCGAEFGDSVLLAAHFQGSKHYSRRCRKALAPVSGAVESCAECGLSAEKEVMATHKASTFGCRSFRIGAISSFVASQRDMRLTCDECATSLQGAVAFRQHYGSAECGLAALRQNTAVQSLFPPSYLAMLHKGIQPKRIQKSFRGPIKEEEPVLSYASETSASTHGHTERDKEILPAEHVAEASEEESPDGEEGHEYIRDAAMDLLDGQLETSTNGSPQESEAEESSTEEGLEEELGAESEEEDQGPNESRPELMDESQVEEVATDTITEHTLLSSEATEEELHEKPKSPVPMFQESPVAKSTAASRASSTTARKRPASDEPRVEPKVSAPAVSSAQQSEEEESSTEKGLKEEHGTESEEEDHSPNESRQELLNESQVEEVSTDTITEHTLLSSEATEEEIHEKPKSPVTMLQESPGAKSTAAPRASSTTARTRKRPAAGEPRVEPKVSAPAVSSAQQSEEEESSTEKGLKEEHGTESEEEDHSPNESRQELLGESKAEEGSTDTITVTEHTLLISEVMEEELHEKPNSPVPMLQESPVAKSTAAPRASSTTARKRPASDEPRVKPKVSAPAVSSAQGPDEAAEPSPKASKLSCPRCKQSFAQSRHMDAHEALGAAACRAQLLSTLVGRSWVAAEAAFVCPSCARCLKSKKTMREHLRKRCVHVLEEELYNA